MASRLSKRARNGLFYALRLAFRMTPMTLATRDRLRQRFLDRHAEWVPDGPTGIAPGDSLPRRPYASSDERAIGYVPYSKGELPHPLPATLVAFYLPQFHTIPENDEWWGKGFTEWRNVTRALPQFEGHHQPRLPGDLGFYDLRNPQVMRDQASLAADYGISAFCFYFYWFGGKTLLESPLEQWLNDDSIILSYCLCWANENWSRRWDGRSDEILIAQQHSAEDDLAFIAHISKYLRDPRYLRVDGAPILLVYRPDLLPSPKETAQRWRNWCRDNDIGEIHIAYVQSFERPDPRDLGFDAAVEFPPNLSNPRSLGAVQRLINPEFQGQVLDWRELAYEHEHTKLPAFTLFPGVSSGWDNEPRRPGGGRVYTHSSPHRYAQWLRRTIHARLAGSAPSRKMVFINAWNEWAEGAVLEPDARLGHAWLHATRHALSVAPSPAPLRPCVVVHAWYLDTFEEILDALATAGLAHRLVVTTPKDKADSVRAILARRGCNAELETSENRGRDVLPFLRVAARLRAEGEDVVLKMHTKRSPHIQNGERWRRELVTGLLADVDAAFGEFMAEPRLGLLVVENHYELLADYRGGNEENLFRLAVRIGIRAPDPACDRFPAGTMYWARLAALAPLLDAHLGATDFEAEAGQMDGTMAHAVERIVATCVDATSFLTRVRPSCSRDATPRASPS